MNKDAMMSQFHGIVSIWKHWDGLFNLSGFNSSRNHKNVTNNFRHNYEIFRNLVDSRQHHVAEPPGARIE